jgi:hypothetical protein
MRYIFNNENIWFIWIYFQELTYLTELLPNLVYRDFLRMLPTEVSVRILMMLDEKSLLNCCLVSKYVNYVLILILWLKFELWEVDLNWCEKNILNVKFVMKTCFLISPLGDFSFTLRPSVCQSVRPQNWIPR